MADDRKVIMNAGEVGCFSCVGYDPRFMESGIVFDEDSADVGPAIDKINSGKYWGLLMSSLVMSNAVDTEKYHEALKKFEKFDNAPYIWRSGGLYVVERACEKGLVVAVNSIAEGPLHLEEAERLGAKCFSMFDGDVDGENLKYFQSFL